MGLATVRSELAAALEATQSATVYRRRNKSYQFPAMVVGWPQSMDVRAAMDGDARDYIIDVTIGIEVADDDAADAELEALIDVAVGAFLSVSAWDVQPVTDFGEELLHDGRVTIWCRLPVAVLA